jgi:hypothetical protein
MSNAKVIIEVNDDNPFNEGWLLYLLGQPRPTTLDEPEAGADPSRAVMDATLRVDGWDMGNDTPTVGLIRRVFAGEQSAYTVTVARGDALTEQAIADQEARHAARSKAKEPVTE